VKSDQFTCNFFLPFFHLRSEGFWFLQTYPGKEILLTSSHSIRGFGQLKDAVAFAYLDETLFLLLMDATSRSILKTVLLTHYFPEFSMLPLGLPSSTVETISDQILHESPVAYQAEIKKADEEEIFVRNGVFKKVVPAIYGYTCCISGMRITATTPVQMIDACHIVPFVMSFDDTISNGFSLCPNLHRAFDRGLIAVDENYQIIVSDIFTETEGGYSIKPYQGKRILLPEKKEQLPSVANFEWHRKNIFKANGVGA
jgi:putative restriction endonuclease